MPPMKPSAIPISIASSSIAANRWKNPARGSVFDDTTTGVIVTGGVVGGTALNPALAADGGNVGGGGTAAPAIGISGSGGIAPAEDSVEAGGGSENPGL